MDAQVHTSHDNIKSHLVFNTSYQIYLPRIFLNLIEKQLFSGERNNLLTITRVLDSTGIRAIRVGH